MTNKWPSFVTVDLGDTEQDEAEMVRRWKVYDQRMKALIAAGDVHQDEDGWWVHTATGELIGPDPELERPLSDAEIAKARPLAEALPDLHQSIQRARGRPRLDNPKQAVTLRIDPDTLEKFKAKGKDWRTQMAAVLANNAPR